MRNLTVAAAMLVAWAAPAAAQTVRFSAEGTDYMVPAPEGYCSSGPAADAYREGQNQSSPDKPSDAVFARCDAVPYKTYDFYVVSVMRGGPRITLPELLAALRRELPVARQRETLVSDSTRANFERNWGEALDRDVKVSSGIHPIQIDDVCGYMGGIIQYRIEGETAQDITAIVCITAIGGHAVYVSHYIGGTDKAAAIAAAPELKQFAQSITARQ
jgi:hypothetical protein